MVRNVVCEPLDADVIKVTIKDKPDAPAAADLLGLSFEALRRFALQERRLRQLGDELAERERRRRLRRVFAAWRETLVARAAPRPESRERKIELLVSAVGAEQKRRAGGAAAAAEQRQELREAQQEARRSSRQTLRVARQALSRCDARTRRSIVHLMREQGCRDKSSLIPPRAPSPPGFLARMEARAEARKDKMRRMDESRQRKREEQRRREEARQREAEEQQRQQQALALREARRARKEQEQRRRRELDRGKRLEQLADELQRRRLCRRYVLQPLRSLVRARNEELRLAERRHADALLARVFSAWRGEWLERQSARARLADKFRRHSLLWYAFADWRARALDTRRKCQLAADFHRAKLQSRCIGAWRGAHEQAKRTEREKQSRAAKHHERSLKSSYFGLWRRYVLVADDIGERERRRGEWRDLIRRFIPDNRKPKKDLLLFSP